MNQTLPFAGETMTCILCGRQEQSDPHHSSNWRAIAIRNRTFYACPQEFPPDDARQEAFTAVYKRIFTTALNRTQRTP